MGEVPSDFEIVQCFVLIELSSAGHRLRWSVAQLEGVLSYIEPELVRAAVDRLCLVGAIRVGGADQAWVIPEIRYLVEIGAITD